ncbi:MAG: 2Fe-2S iron-sulfur cluster binding domain-containing protein [Hyphomicrobiales bacterium]
MTITLQSKSGEYKFETAEDEPILFAGLKAGLKLPYDCATGTCGSCRARVMDGNIDMAWTDAPGMARYKADKGDILMCQTRANGDCVLRVPSDTPDDQSKNTLPKLHHGTVDVVKKLTSDVIHYEIAMREKLSFQAGQFMVVEAPNLTGGRAYSMVNYDTSTDRISFVVKRNPNGGFSDWIFENDITGSQLRLFGPLGRATFHPEEDKDLICIVGGSGIAGIMSILDHATRSGHLLKRKAKLFFGVRTLADAFYMSELSSMMKEAKGNLEVTLVLSDEAPSASVHPDFPDITLAGGFVTDVAAGCVDGDNSNVIGYLAGPAPMVDAATRVLIVNAGLSAQQIRYDKFS